MVRRTKKKTTFFILGIVALLALGVGYASWTDQLTFNGEVNTADVNVVWANLSVPNADFDDPLGVATCIATLTGSDKNVNLVIDNAYPGVSCEITADVFNDSSVPVTVTDVDFNEPAELNITGLCVAPGQEIAANSSHPCSLTVTVNGNAEPGETYVGDATFDFEVNP